MFGYRGIGTRLIFAACLTAFLAGCPLKGDNGLTLILTPEVLNFEADTDMLTFQVHRNLTNSPVEPVVVSSNQAWITPEVCTEAADNCLGFGIVDRLLIPIRVDRNLMLLGTNRGEIIVRTGGAADQKLTVYAEDVLYIDFRVNNRRPAVGQAVSFEDASEKTDAAGDVVSRLWKFGDGATSTATDPIHVYNQPGLYSISLTVTTANGEETTRKAAWITVGNPSPDVDFEASRTNIYEGGSVLFTNISVPQTEPVTSLLWNFGDGRTSTDTRPEHQYTEPGVYTVSLTVNTANTTETETKNNFIIVQRKVAPDARIAVNPSSPIARSEARFSDVSEPGSAAIQQWFWDFGDGTTSRLENPPHTYDQGGNYQVSLYVVSAHGSDTVTETVTVVTIPPTANFSISDRNPFILTPVTFTDASLPGSAPIDEYLWEFGDSASSVLQNPTHTYNSAGTFTVRLTVVSAHGSNTATDTITVAFKPPTAEFSGAPRSPNVGQAVQFMDQSLPGTAAVNQWIWDFGDPDSGDANISISQNPSHTYNAPGPYTVTLTVRTPVSSDNSDTIVKEAYIEAVQAPAPAFTFSVPDPDAPDVVQFANMTLQGSEQITNHLWDFGDPNSLVNTSTAQNPTHQFSTAGVFTVTLTEQTATREVSISQAVTVVFIPPVAEFDVETGTATPRENVLDDGALTTDTLQFLSQKTFGTEVNPDLFTYAWDFGDGNTSTLEEPTHQYENGGTYTVTFTITTPTSQVQVSHDIAVDEPPTPAFSALPQIAATGTEIQFFDQSTGGDSPIDSRLWIFGDNTVSTGENPAHIYTTAGQYDVTLTLGFTHSVTGAPLSISLTKTGFIQISN